jgi:hypothetical protein
MGARRDREAASMRSVMVLMSATGWSGSIDRTASRRDGAIFKGSPAARAARNTFGFEAWSKG